MTNRKECSFSEKPNSSDSVNRQAVIDTIEKLDIPEDMCVFEILSHIEVAIGALPSAQPDESKYEYHYDHTDCIWYRPEARNRCPVTCAQYRDGWNDAMNYIFRDGKGYRPYRRDEQYGE